MCQNDLIPFQHIYEESKNIYKLLFTLNGAAIVSLVTLIVSYDKNDVLNGGVKYVKYNTNSSR